MSTLPVWGSKLAMRHVPPFHQIYFYGLRHGLLRDEGLQQI